jgi:phosphatidyl-myo-inositol alpha-mannosyltransferase
MKIGFVFDDSLDTTDGIQQYMASLSAWLKSEGHEVHFLVGETKRTDIPNVHSLAKNFSVKFNDVLHVQVPYHPLLAGRIIRAAGPDTKVVGTFHIAPYSRLALLATRLLGIWSALSLKRFNAMVSVSPAAQELALKAYKIDSQVVPNVFNYARFAQATQLETSQTATILFLGRLVPRKGCQILLESIRILAERQLNDFRVVICGDGQLRNKLEEYARKHGISDRVEFVGRVSEEDKPRYMAMADIAVFPSSGGESFGIVLLEAMASGNAAVLGGDNPGYRSVLGSRSEQLFDPRDPVALADTLSQLLSDDSLRQAAAAWGALESQQYDVAIVGSRLLELYRGSRHDSN